MTERVVVYGDFNCPWSYLAFRRAAVLAESGVDVEWCAVEHSPRRPGWAHRSAARFEELRGEMDRVLAMLVPDEQLPYDLSGFVPSTAAAISAYAESKVAGADRRTGRVIFESFWMHGVDIGDPKLLRTVLADQLRGTASPSEAVREWGYPTDVTGGPISTAAWRLTLRWSSEWQAAEKGIVPMLVRPDGTLLHGVDAVEWLGGELLSRGLRPRLPELAAHVRVAHHDHADLRWATSHGGRWLERSREAARAS